MDNIDGWFTDLYPWYNDTPYFPDCHPNVFSSICGVSLWLEQCFIFYLGWTCTKSSIAVINPSQTCHR